MTKPTTYDMIQKPISGNHVSIQEEGDTPDTKLADHKKVVLDVREFGTTCPDCGVNDLFLNVDEQKNGIDFEPPLSEKFIQCFKCGCLMEVVGVRIEPLEKIRS